MTWDTCHRGDTSISKGQFCLHIIAFEHEWPLWNLPGRWKHYQISMCWHRQEETSVGSAGGLKFDRYQGESSRGFFNPTFGMSSPRAATSVATRKVLFPLAFRSTSPKKLESDNYTTKGLASNLFGTHLVKNFRDIWVHDSTCHSWHTSNWFTQVSWCLDISWSCNSPRLENSETSWKWTARFLAPFAPDRILSLRQGWTKLWVGIASPYSVRTWHQFLSYTSLQKHDIVKVNREKGVQVAQTPAFGPGQKHEMAIFQPPLLCKSKVKVSEVTPSILMYSTGS